MIAQYKQTGLAWIWLALLVLIADQVSKIAVLQSFQLYDSVKITEFFNLTYVRNYGAAFSFLADSGGWQRWFFTLIAVVAVVLLSYWLAKTPKKQIWLVIGFNLILGGAAGNLYDRVAYGYVVDFLDFTIPLYGRWPAFNIADMGIVIGAACVLIDAFIHQNKQQANENKT
ncbi:lipoprotein signal peptidase [Catenovulum agarivorans DS-2]|uniref:Lipoprotein signal peptidase n=1 Tax=Catenovulum agarivorans DS-2 TaxID=1328313 RepID=W7Q859_9ALTE|nr:signal peptidase II [Catenovulum agarivorans]EWH09004.1 lipoprotein signal peptidase [Catenovulum agarivorans DS-2]